MKKKVSIFVLIVFLLTSSIAFADGGYLKAYLTKIGVNLDGVRVLDEVVTINGTTYLPLRQIATMLGVDVSWNSFTNEVNLINNKPQTIEPRLTYSDIGYIADVKYVYDNGTVYEGQIRNGIYHGDNNKITFPDGTVYNGQFVDGVISGIGKYTAINGDKYEGTFYNSQYSGYGKYTYVNGDVIEGQFSNNKLVADSVVYVKYKATNQTEYMKGEDWKRPITGVNTYTLTFDKTKFNGTADIVFRDGTHYKGAVSNNTFNGQGEITYIDGSTYKGNWVSDQKTGRGTFTYAYNTRYEGYFLNNQYEGEGQFYYANGDVYDGTWKANKRHGYGKYTYANGNYFSGEWVNDSKHTLDQKDDKDYKGYGEFVMDGKNNPKLDGKRVVYKQKWDNGKLIREVKDN